MGFTRQEHWSELPCPPLGDLPDPGTEPMSLSLLHRQMGSLPLVPPGKTPLSGLFISKDKTLSLGIKTSSLWQKAKKEPLDESEEESEKAGLKLNIQKTKIMASSPIT